MRVRAKPSGISSNSNDAACDGSANPTDNYFLPSFDGGCLNSIITDLLDECGVECSTTTCQDADACNNGDNADCIYPSENHDCCGECTAIVDCLGVCGGDATEEDCFEASGGCPTCTIVCHPDDDECLGDYTSIQEAIDNTQEGLSLIHI